jgi:hypothetical protein
MVKEKLYKFIGVKHHKTQKPQRFNSKPKETHKQIPF